MPNIVVIGMQWGDEGKGKIVDLLCPAFDAVARYQGGHNAGHTVKFGDTHFSLHLIPSGIVRPGMRCFLGNGMVIEPDAFGAELDQLANGGVSVDGRLFVSDRAHLIGPGLDLVDRAREAARGTARIGTTARGIGPAYELKVARRGLRVADLYSSRRDTLVTEQITRAAAELDALGADSGPLESVADRVVGWADRLRPFVCDTASALQDLVSSGGSVLFEGAQGTMLDIDFGTYPYVTSSSPTAGGACTGTGVPPTALDGVVGILKAYTTRVGEGPFPTELDDAAGAFLRERGNEFGTTTGRPRRCGWLDLVVARQARRINGIESVALTKLDVLDELDELLVCEAYELDGRRLETLPADIDQLTRARPVYRSVAGWRSETVGVLERADLPPAARDYVELIERELAVSVDLVSTGPRREETVLETTGALGSWLGERAATVLDGRG